MSCPLPQSWGGCQWSNEAQRVTCIIYHYYLLMYHYYILSLTLLLLVITVFVITLLLQHYYAFRTRRTPRVVDTRLSG